MTSYLPGWEYDVFLSFNDQDTSRKFADHLLSAMDKKGIVAYCRSEDVGERVQLPTSVEAIRGSRFAVIVFSVNYASSLTCLDEISKIVETRKTAGRTILPVFYDVDPSVVRKQSHSFKNPFDEYLVRFENELDKVEKWRAALSEVASISGWHLHDKSENQCIQEIVKAILSKLNDSFTNVADELVGIDSRVDELMSYLELQSRDVIRTIAICGVPGIGKTTIARCVCDKIFGDFQGTCFLTNVSQASRKNGIEKLQAQIISEIFNEDTQQLYDARRMAVRLKNMLQRQSVLLILDGVDDLEHLEMLAGDQDWFRPGSRIIITATDEDLFRNYDVDAIYKPGELREDEAFRLLSLKAFNQAYPPEEYVELSKQIVTNAKCIPAAIDALGTFLYGRSSNEWESTVRRLQENPKL
ncbi:unnamed protein product [Rhodiola kirilowii]